MGASSSRTSKRVRVAAVGAEDEGGDVRRTGRTRQPGKGEVGVGAPVAVATLARDPGPRRLTAQEQRVAEGRPADLDAPDRLRVRRNREALDRPTRQDARRVGARRDPAQGPQGDVRTGGGDAQRQARGDERGSGDQEAGSPPCSIQRRRSSASTQPNAHWRSSLTSIDFAPAMSPSITFNSP